MTITKTTLADAITNYIESHEVANDYKKTIFVSCANRLNQIIVEAKEKQAHDCIEIPKSSLLRNHIPWYAVMLLGVVERLAVVLIEDEDMEPLAAVERACYLCPADGLT
jgi:hypothetical protein